MAQLSHFDDSGATRMVQVGAKEISLRMARAECVVVMQPVTLQLIMNRQIQKGDVCEVARLAGIMATKRTADLIPLCHPIGLEGVEIQIEVLGNDRLRFESQVSVHARTGVEMEALTAVSVAALTLYDMCKASDRGIEITGIRLLEKSGGKSGHFLREDRQLNAVSVLNAVQAQPFDRAL